jgi:hypothetical protein
LPFFPSRLKIQRDQPEAKGLIELMGMLKGMYRLVEDNLKSKHYLIFCQEIKY